MKHRRRYLSRRWASVATTSLVSSLLISSSVFAAESSLPSIPATAVPIVTGSILPSPHLSEISVQVVPATYGKSSSSYSASAQAATPPTGISLEQLNGPLPPVITMVNATTGWAFDGTHFLHTTDGGRQWTNVTPPGMTVHLDRSSNSARNTVWDFQSAQSTWIAEATNLSGTVLLSHTVDGGQRWIQHTIQFSGISQFGAISALGFVNARQGWLEWGMTDLWKTENGGASWQPAVITKVRGLPPGGGGLVTFINARTGWMLWSAGGNPGPQFFLKRTTNGAHSWHQVPISFIRGLMAYGFPTFTGSAGLLACMREFGGLVVLRTQNGGKRWEGVSPTIPNRGDTSEDSWGIKTVGGMVAWALAEGRLWRSTNGARSWTYRSSDRFLVHASGMDFLNAQMGWVWKATPTGITHVWMTTSGGRHWTSWQPVIRP